jgi:nucleotidyltransferase/DNA polymerase involved in DNA repair
MRAIVFVRLNGFYLAAEGSGSVSTGSVAVFRGGEVLEVSVAAERWGVRAGISKRLARQRCPELGEIEHNPDLCRNLFHRIWCRLAELSPRVEPLDFHEGFLDLSGSGRCAQSLMEEARWKIHFDAKVDFEWGGGEDRWMARLACGANRCVAAHEEAAFLKTVPLRALGLPPELRDRLLLYGIKTVAEFLTVPRSFFQSHLRIPAGIMEPFLRRDGGRVRALFPPRQMEIPRDLEAGDDLAASLKAVAAEAAHRLAESGQQCGALRMILKTRGDSFTAEREFSIPLTGTATFEQALHVFARQTGRDDWCGVVLILRDLLPAAGPQFSLWQQRIQRDERAARCATVRARLNTKFGSQAIRTATDYARQRKPRFAQLVCAKRGILLP